MSDLSSIAGDPVTIVLLGALILLVGLPGVLLATWQVTRPPFGIESFRWIYLAWACLLAATSSWTLSRTVTSSAAEAGANNFVRLAFLSLGILVILFIAAKYRFALFSQLTSGVLGIFFVFALWGLASTLWSVSRAGTLYKASEYCAMVILFALVASLVSSTIRDPRRQLLVLKGVFDWNWFLIFSFLASVYVGMLFWPANAIKHGVGALGFQIQGAIPGISANGVGQLAAIMGVVALTRMLLKSGSKILYVPILMVSLLSLVLAQSRTPILGFLLAVVVVLAAHRRFGRLAFVGALGAVLFSTYGQTIYEFMERGQNDENFSTLSGRTTYWEASFRALSEDLFRGISGYGANAGGRHVMLSAFGGDDVSSSVHSTYVEALLGTGLVGIVLLLAGLGVAWFWLLRIRSYVAGNSVGYLLWLECLGVFTVLTVRSVFTITFVWTSTVLTLGLILVFVTVMRTQISRRDSGGASLARGKQVSATRRRRPGARV
jgi:O-antigen ligase